MANDRTYVAGKFALDIDGYNVGFLKSFDGLGMSGEVVANDLGPDNLQKKHIANIGWTPGKAKIGIGMGKGMYDWIRASFEKGHITKNGTLTAADFDYNAQSQLSFYNALITKVGFPKLDGASKEAAYFDVEFDAEQVRWAKAGGERIKGNVGPKQKAWLCSNWRLSIGSLPCQRVGTIDAFTWECKVASDQIGTFREYTKHPAKVTTPDLTFTVSYADFQPWADAAKKWFVDGEHLEEHEMTGVLEMLDPTMKQPIGQIEFLNLGFKKFENEPLEANSEKIKRFKVTMYCEGMRFTLNYVDA